MRSIRNTVFSALKRVLFSLMSTVFAMILFCALLSLYSVLRRPIELAAFPPIFVYLSIFVAYCAWPGWVLSLPAVLLFANVRGRRYWALFIVGTAIGPVTLFFRMHGRYTLSFGIYDAVELFLAALISGSSTFVYLRLLRRSQGSDPQNESSESKPLKPASIYDL